MAKKKKTLTRRDFLGVTAGAAVIGSVGCGSKEPDKTAPGEGIPEQREIAERSKPVTPKIPKKRATVVLIRDASVLDKDRTLNEAVLVRMLDEGITTLLGAPTVEEAFTELLKPTDTVGIKSNVWRFLATPAVLEQALRERAIGAGVPAGRIDIDDRGVRTNPVFQAASALINIRPLRTHHWSGVGSLIKNYIMFSDSPSSWHDDSCANLAGVWDLPAVKGKTRLNILVMLSPLFQGKGPHHFQSKYTWAYNGLLLGKDPVAVDATGVRILEAKRKAYFGAEQPFSVPPKHIAVAESKYNLGVADPDRIDLIKLGWNEGALV